jgi:hypothetical protein
MLRSKDLVLTVVVPDSPVRIQTNLFYLQELIFKGIETIVNEAESVGTIRVELRNMNSGAEIRFTSGSLPQNFSFLNSVTNETNSLMTWLKAEPVDGIEEDSFGIRFPESISAVSKEH